MSHKTIEAKHTSGPWHVNAIKNNRIVGDETAVEIDKLQINNSNATVATVYRSRDARLIAAAPELLAALKALVNDFDKSVIATDPMLIEARTVIAKAEGTVKV